MSELKKQTVSGVKWLVGSSFLQKAIQTGATIFLARILGPTDFGLFALAFVAIDALGLFKSMGFDSALIQRKDNVEKAANTAFFVIPVLGTVLYLILFVSAPFIAQFMNNAQLTGIIRALGLIFVISCLGKVPAALLEKSMKFKQVSIIEIGTALIYAISAIIFAVLQLGVWSLVLAYILKTFYQNIMAFIYSGWKPKIEFDRNIAIEMFHFGKFLFLSGVLMFLKSNLDNIMVGKILGITALGLYAISFNIANLLSDYLGSKVNRVIYPSLSILQKDDLEFRRVTLKIFKYMSLIVMPFGVAVSMSSKELLVFIYGDKWVGGSSILCILAWSGIFNTLPIAFGAALLAKGISKPAFWMTFLQVLIFASFIMPASKIFNVNGVAIVVTSATFFGCLVGIIWSASILSIKLKDIILNIKPALILTSIILLAIILIKHFYNYYKLSNPISFIVIIILTMGIYFLYVARFEYPILKEVKDALF